MDDIIRIVEENMKGGNRFLLFKQNCSLNIKKSTFLRCKMSLGQLYSRPTKSFVDKPKSRPIRDHPLKTSSIFGG